MTFWDKYDWATDDQAECLKLLIRLFMGEHHLAGKIEPWGFGIRHIVNNPQLATFDFNRLTRLVLLAHEMCIRAEINPHAFKYLSIALHKRHRRNGSIFERHPTIEEAIMLERDSLIDKANRRLFTRKRQERWDAKLRDE